jgi:hypothetical protein
MWCNKQRRLIGTTARLLRPLPDKRSDRRAREFSAGAPNTLFFDYVYGLRSFVTLGDFELNVLSFIQSFESIAIDRAVMNKDITTAFFFYKTIPFGIVKPFDLA